MNPMSVFLCKKVMELQQFVIILKFPQWNLWFLLGVAAQDMIHLADSFTICVIYKLVKLWEVESKIHEQ